MSNYSTFEAFMVSGTATNKLPELRYIQNKEGGADAVLNLSICADRPLGRSADGDVQFAPQWYKVVMWGQQAEAVAQKLTPGCTVLVKDAYLDVAFWTNADKSLVMDNNGKPRYNLELKRGRVMVMNSKPDPDADNWRTE